MHTPPGLVTHLSPETRILVFEFCKALKNKDKNFRLFSGQSKKNPCGKAI
jgi:hypothetical protein